MNKSDLVNILKLKSDSFSKDDIEKAVKSILDLITESLAKNQRVEVRNFGTFSTRRRERRLSRNPRTGSSVLVEEKKHPYFRASMKLKRYLNK
tara:strand:- start:90 stop:368 length:279 start_codon:yes stop_codon:yes gene_type:complete